MITECLAYGAYSAVHVPTKLDQPIEEMSVKEEYVEKIQQLQCLIGIKTHTALSLIMEKSDSNRLKKKEICIRHI